MPNEVTESNTPQQEVVSTNWDAFTNDHTNAPLTQEQPKAEEPKVEETTVIEDKAPIVEEEKPKEEIKAEEPVKEPLKEEAPLIEFKADEILKDVTLAEEGTWLRVAQDLKLDIKEDSYEAFEAAIVEKSTAPLIAELESIKTSGKIDYLATLKPETAAVFKLMEMGVPEAELFAPTRQIEEYLRLDNAQIVRADLEALGWKPDMVDAEMELLDSKNLIDHQAEKIRLTLNEEKTNIIEQRNQLVQQFETRKEQAALIQQQQEDSHFEKALTTVEKFMDTPVTKEIKDAILQKYHNGGYKDILQASNAKVELILHNELGKQLIKSLRNTAYEKGRDEITNKLLNVPPKTASSVGQTVDTNNQLTNNDNWAAFERDHK